MSAHSFSSLDVAVFPSHSHVCVLVVCTFGPISKTKCSPGLSLQKHTPSNTDMLTDTFSCLFPKRSFLPLSSLYHSMERITEASEPERTKLKKIFTGKGLNEIIFIFFIALDVGLHWSFIQQEVTHAVNGKKYMCSLIYGFNPVINSFSQLKLQVCF